MQCYDEDNGSDDFIGSVTVHLNQVFAQGMLHLNHMSANECNFLASDFNGFSGYRDEYFPLVTQSSRPSGKLRLVLRFEPQGPQAAPGSMYATQASAYSPGYGPPPSVYGAPTQYAPHPSAAFGPQSHYAAAPSQGPASHYGQSPAPQLGQSLLPPRNSGVPPQGAYGAPPPQGGASAYGQDRGGFNFGTPVANPFDVASTVAATYAKYGMNIQ